MKLHFMQFSADSSYSLRHASNINSVVLPSVRICARISSLECRKFTLRYVIQIRRNSGTVKRAEKLQFQMKITFTKKLKADYFRGIYICVDPLLGNECQIRFLGYENESCFHGDGFLETHTSLWK
jgi:hypothetical protein